MGNLLNDPKHPLWNLMRLLVVGLVLLGALALNYKNGFHQATDLTTLVEVLLALAGFDGLKKAFVKEAVSVESASSGIGLTKR